jgi:hypothetical protein
MKSPNFFIYDDYADELQLKEFFPVPLHIRLKKAAKSSFWPFVIAAVVAAAVAVTVAVVTGGLSIPGTGLIAAYQGVFFPLVKKIVIGAMAAVSFVSTFFFSKWFIAKTEAKKAEEFTNHMKAGYEDSHEDLPEKLSISNLYQTYITGYNKIQQTVTVADESTPHAPERVCPKDECFIPLATPRDLNRLGDRVTHYREQHDYFRIHKSDGTEVDLSRDQMLALRDQSTQASLFLSRPPTMRRQHQAGENPEEVESGNSSILSINGSPPPNK